MLYALQRPVRADGTLRFLLSDHIGSSSVTTNASGAKTASALYKAFGESRFSNGSLYTDYKFTGQREESALGIYFFVARWFDPSLGRFLSPDTIVPTSTQGTQAWDRYAFVNNNPVRYNDPTGHELHDMCDYYGDCDDAAYSQNPLPVIGLTTNACNMNACTAPPQVESSPSIPSIPPSNIGWQSPEFIFNQIDLGVYIISGSYQIEGSINNESPVTATNNDVQVGPIGVDFSDSELSSNYQGIPGMSIGLTHPLVSFDMHSTGDFGNLHIDQTLSINAEFRWEAPAALAVLAAGYEAILYLLGAAASGGLQHAFP